MTIVKHRTRTIERNRPVKHKVTFCVQGVMPPIRVQYPGSSPVDEAVEQLGDEWQAVAERYV